MAAYLFEFGDHIQRRLTRIIGAPDGAANDNVIRSVCNRFTRCCDTFLVPQIRPCGTHARRHYQTAL